MTFNFQYRFQQFALTLLLYFLFLSGVSPSHHDVKVNNDILTALYSPDDGEPRLVAYKLWRGGGTCKRSKFHFHADELCSITASDGDYAHSGFDKGHLADAEDFASNCTAEEETFRYYNCIPQSAHLNRGSWKHWETLIRELSQSDSLLIFCGPVLTAGLHKVKSGSTLTVPDQCFKVVESLSTKKVLHVLLFSQDGTNQEITMTEMDQSLGFPLESWLKK